MKSKSDSSYKPLAPIRIMSTMAALAAAAAARMCMQQQRVENRNGQSEIGEHKCAREQKNVAIPR